MTENQNTNQELSFTLKELTTGMQTFIDMKRNSIYHYQGLTQQEMVCLVLTEFLSFSKKEQDEKNQRYQEYLKLKAEFEGTEHNKEQPKDTPWYPDDSGEWVEVPDDVEAVPEELNMDEVVIYLLRFERNEKHCLWRSQIVSNLEFRNRPDSKYRIVAYKKVK